MDFLKNLRGRFSLEETAAPVSTAKNSHTAGSAKNSHGGSKTSLQTNEDFHANNGANNNGDGSNKKENYVDNGENKNWNVLNSSDASVSVRVAVGAAALPGPNFVARSNEGSTTVKTGSTTTKTRKQAGDASALPNFVAGSNPKEGSTTTKTPKAGDVFLDWKTDSSAKFVSPPSRTCHKKSPPTATKPSSAARSPNPFLSNFEKEEEEEEEATVVKIISPTAAAVPATDSNVDADSEDEEPTTPIPTSRKKKSMPALKGKAEILEDLESSESEDEESTAPKIARKKSTVRTAKAKTTAQKKATASTIDAPVLEKKKPATRTTTKQASKKAATPRTSAKKNNSTAGGDRKAKTPTPKRATFSPNVTPGTAKKKAPPPTTAKPAEPTPSATTKPTDAEKKSAEAAAPQVPTLNHEGILTKLQHWVEILENQKASTLHNILKDVEGDHSKGSNEIGAEDVAAFAHLERGNYALESLDKGGDAFTDGMPIDDVKLANMCIATLQCFQFMQEAERTFGCFQATPHDDAKNEHERACLKLSVNKPAVKRKPASTHRKENERDGFNDPLVASQNHQRKLDGAKHKKRVRNELAYLSNRNEDDSSDDSDTEDPHPKTHQDDPVLSPKPRNGCHPEAQAAAEKKKKGQQRQPPVKKGSRVQVKRSAIVHLLPIHLQKHIPSGDENFHCCCGTAVKKAMGPKPTHDIKLDCFPSGEIAPGIRRDKFKTLNKGDDEPPCDPRRLESQQREEEDTVAEVKDAEEVLSEKEFCAQTQEQLRAATAFTHHFDNKKAEDIVWDIKEAGDDISDCEKWTELKHEAQQGPTISPEALKDLEELENHELFIKRCWPDMTGFGRRMDEHYDDSRADGHCTVKQRRIKFHDAEHEDPDWKLKHSPDDMCTRCVWCGKGRVLEERHSQEKPTSRRLR